MSNRFEEVVAHHLTAKSEHPDLRPEPMAMSRFEYAWHWILRLVLPLLAALSGLVLYWLWSGDHGGGRRWLDVVGGMALAFEVVLVMLWAAGSWYFADMT